MRMAISMYAQRANLLPERFDAIVSYGHANMIRQNVVEICQELIEDEEGFANRGDKQWVYMTLAEAYQGLGQTSDEERLGRKIESEATDFGKDSYLEQKAKLKEAIDEFERKVRPDELSAKPAAGDPGSRGAVRRARNDDAASPPGRLVRHQPHHHRCRHRARKTDQVDRGQLKD